MWFQYDGATTHFMHDVRNLDTAFHDYWLRVGGSTAWPSLPFSFGVTSGVSFSRSLWKQERLWQLVFY